jgi:hypothetical protein
MIGVHSEGIGMLAIGGPQARALPGKDYCRDAIEYLIWLKRTGNS